MPPGLVWMRVERRRRRSTRPWRSSSSEAEQIGLVDATGAEPRRPAAARGRERGDSSTTCSARSASTSVGRRSATGACASSWVVDFPLFEAIDDDGRPIPAHHPFTMPHPDDLELLEHGAGEELLDVRSLAYDLVLNGWELGSGSVRIHQPEIAAAGLRAARHRARGRAGAVRLPARRVPVRRAAARRLRVRHRPARRDPRRRGEHPRGDRVPEDPVGRRPADRRADARSSPTQLARARPRRSAKPNDRSTSSDR